VAISFGNDYAVSSISTANTRTDALTLGSIGANSILFVLVEAANNDYTTPITMEYNSVPLTSLGGKQTYVGAGTNTYKELFYCVDSLTSGQNLFIDSNVTTGLGQNGARSWIYRYWTYGGVDSLGTTKVNTTDFTTSAAEGPVSVAFNFTPTASNSTILQMLPGNSISITTTTYGSTTGTTRQGISPLTYGAASGWLAFSDYAPGSDSLYSISQSFWPNFTTATGYGWGVEMLPAAGLTSKNTQAVWIG